ncbi:uncharacterized protein CLUP02_11891 [Colletotrichum lupini]|uniref:Uncharacterized protein n=1 Tax=Colletotrichum lupini TaxID=145971 RepID=A0A9Q8WKW1_9PEZI|nr:uncharacterized protein CLUP02_11891 [Colletotrichum lupini]UQC86390.1 hypothetical protein CLUP02_11891 [Colletotrichum lupini]
MGMVSYPHVIPRVFQRLTCECSVATREYVVVKGQEPLRQRCVIGPGFSRDNQGVFSTGARSSLESVAVPKVPPKFQYGYLTRNYLVDCSNQTYPVAHSIFDPSRLLISSFTGAKNFGNKTRKLGRMGGIGRRGGAAPVIGDVGMFSPGGSRTAYKTGMVGVRKLGRHRRLLLSLQRLKVASLHSHAKNLQRYAYSFIPVNVLSVEDLAARRSGVRKTRTVRWGQSSGRRPGPNFNDDPESPLGNHFQRSFPAAQYSLHQNP